MPDMKRTDVGEAELCNACAFIRTGNQQCKTAVVTGNNSAYWEEEFDLEYESEDEVIAEILHCDQVGSDISLGSAHIPIAELFSSHAAELSSGEEVERSISLEAKPSHPLGQTPALPAQARHYHSRQSSILRPTFRQRRRAAAQRASRPPGSPLPSPTRRRRRAQPRPPARRALRNGAGRGPAGAAPGPAITRPAGWARRGRDQVQGLSAPNVGAAGHRVYG